MLAACDLITVVIPTIEERADMLAEALESVGKQTVGEPAVLVAVDSDRVGPAEVRNRLVEQVCTPWILFLDDDDLLHADYLETVMPSFDESDIVYTWCVEDGFNVGLDRLFDEVELKRANYIPVTICVKTELFRSIGGFPSGVAYEDWAMYLKFLDVGAKWTLIPEKKWTYRRHDGSRTYQNHYKIAAGLITEA